MHFILLQILQLFLQSLQKIESLEINRIFPGHHQLVIPTELLFQIEAGFCELADKGVSSKVVVCLTLGYFLFIFNNDLRITEDM